MTASPVMVDSSWYIGMMRSGNNPMRELLRISLTRDVATCGVVRCEVARGIRDRALLEKFQKRWDVMLYTSTDNRLWEEVERMAWMLDRRGQVIPLTAIIIACCAMRLGAVVLTLDRHFETIPGLESANRIV